MLRLSKIMLAASVALWGLLGAAGNILGWNATLGAVAAVTSMSTFPGGSGRWQATTNVWIILAGALFITIAKIGCGLLCLDGGWSMWSARKADAPAFNAAKAKVLAGCAVAIFMLFTGFLIIGEGWFEMWRSDALREQSAEGAFRYAGMIALIALFIAARDE